jgi:hypothetical protein
MRPQAVFITLGFVLVIIGMCFGVWIGLSEEFVLAGTHAHLNLLGFVTSVLYGLIHSAYPKLVESRLAWPQCIAHFIGVLIFVPGIAIVVTTGEPLVVAIGSSLVLLAATMFLFMYVRHALTWGNASAGLESQPVIGAG